MKSKFDMLKSRFDIEIIAPFDIKIEGEEYIFDCLIKGAREKTGMIIDKDWSKIEPLAQILLEIGYGFSCFDIFDNEDIESFQEVLEDWGIISLKKKQNK